MSIGRIRAQTAVVGVGILGSLAFIPTPSWAAGGMKLCLPKAEGAGLVTPKHGKCKHGYKLTTLSAGPQAGPEGKQGAAGKAGPEGKQGPEGTPGPEGKTGFTTEQAERLKALLPYIRFVGTGVDGKPTVQFSGVNVQIVNGLGSTRSTNGKGNLVIGYDETGVATEKGGPIKPVLQTGSHNLILGEEQWFTSYGGIVAGLENSITGPFASVTGGMANTASGGLSSVTGGGNSTASGARSSISGGAGNRAEGTNDSISGGEGNHIEGVNPLGAPTGAWIGGGLGNRISDTPGAALEFGADAAIFGGKQLSTNVNFAAIP